MLIFTILITLISQLISGSQEIEISCKPCGVPAKFGTIYLAPGRPPCLHPGQPIFSWPGGLKCPVLGPPTRLWSPKIGLLEEESLVLAKERICFFDGPLKISYQYQCEGSEEIYSSEMKIGHPNFPDRRNFGRVKRWARRRNPDANTVHFQQDKYVRELPEDTPIDTIVASVKATHASKKTLYYSMVAPQDSRSQNLFTLDTTSGEIRLAKSLDRETLDKHILKVTAYERTEPTVLATTTVVVHVLDVQDNVPIFEKDSYFGEIREDAPIGTTVLSVFARDMDADENGEVEYSLADGDGKNLLSINPKSGVVQTSAPLDRETLSIIRLDVIASDKGTPRKESKAFIEITVVDVNDNAPVFEKDSYNITISENITLPAVILTVKASDIDGGQNGKVHYSMASASSGINIDYSSGQVTLRDRIDAKNSPLTAIIRAKDGAQPALSSTVTLTINVIDINDHAPNFIAAQKLITLEENVAIGEEVGRVYAIDEDSGKNGMVSYFLEGAEDFMIDRETGVIRTTRLLDRENVAKYSLKITASDQGTPPLNTSTIISVILKDINDNPPIFEKTEYNVTISEELPRGSQIITLKAKDIDEDQKISYKIEETTRDIFSILEIGEMGAILSISGEISRSDHLIRVEVSATDQGNLQGRCVVNVFVSDVNSAPVFVDHPFSVKIPEHSPIGYPVIALKAIDNDRDSNAALTYTIDTASSEHFKIDATSGELAVARDLDREDLATFTIQVTATDQATPPLSATTQLEVILDDINDNAPQFTSSSYAATISEDIPVGTSFLQVSAIDSDIGANGIVDYFLNETGLSDVGQLFRLDRTSGTLRVNSKLDRETHKELEQLKYHDQHRDGRNGNRSNGQSTRKTKDARKLAFLSKIPENRDFSAENCDFQGFGQKI
ncbi:unnamed protein product [Caenorhabditis angaria]|uniref:Cadherin domain-containing protein n=1 Tax=Caenorhabditis angaria TaxID=860376 RepID=A0A9P1N872_9PELO|nr:unnamed protein product [Caenorhabditis angaria]